MRNTILFDLRGTLAHYYDMSEFPFILGQAIREVQCHFDEKGLLTVTPELIRPRVREEDHESVNYRCRPLEGRLARIFGLEASIVTDELLTDTCRSFMRPIFARGHCDQDTRQGAKTFAIAHYKSKNSLFGRIKRTRGAAIARRYSFGTEKGTS